MIESVSKKTMNKCKAIFSVFYCSYPFFAKQFVGNSEEATKLIKNQMYNNWGVLIDQLSDEALTKGMEAFRRGRSPFVDRQPTSFQFYEFCKQYEPKKETICIQQKRPVASENVRKKIKQLCEQMRKKAIH